MKNNSIIRFFLKIIIASFIVIAVLFQVIMPQYTTNYNTAYLDKLDRANRLGNNKIILMGDSNVAFGIDSKLLEERFGKPVVNMGLHGDLGQYFCMDLAKDCIREGDIVILLPIDYSERNVNGPLAWIILESRLSLLWKIDPRDFYAIIKGFPVYIRKASDLWLTHLGNINGERQNFNEYGDYVGIGEMNIMKNGVDDVSPFVTDVSEDVIHYFNEYNAYVQKKGGTALLAGVPILDETASMEDVLARDVRVQELLDFPYISNAQDYYYPKEYFYNTNYHLNKTGRIIRTEQLLDDLERWLQREEEN